MKKKAVKKISKSQVKKIKDEAKGTVRAENDNLICFVCDRPILKGQAMKELAKNEKHNYRRPYHSATCGVGSKAWAKMSGSKLSNNLAEKPEKKETKTAGEKKEKQAKTVKEVVPTRLRRVYSLDDKKDLLIYEISRLLKPILQKEKEWQERYDKCGYTPLWNILNKKQSFSVDLHGHKVSGAFKFYQKKAGQVFTKNKEASA